MKYPALFFALLVSDVALAQQPSPQQAEKIFNLQVSSTDVGLLGEALGTLPYGRVAGLMQRLQVQINQQNAPAPKPEVPKVEEKKD